MRDAREQLRQLTRILDVTRRLAATTDLDVLLGMIVEAACDVLDCERATIFLYDDAAHELYARVATGADEIRFAAELGIAGAAAQQRVVVNVPDAYADERFNQEIDRQTGFHTRNLLTFPLENLEGELMGVLQALNKAGGPFDQDDEALARLLSAQAGVALHRWRLLEEYAEKQRLARDLHIARNIQQDLFPRDNPTISGYEIAGWNRPADETGGDCYDFFPLDDGRLAVLLADATGHGIGAALVVAQCRALMRAMLSVKLDLPGVAAAVNNLMVDDLADDRFVTAFIGILDPAEHRVDYVAAGQGPLLMLSPPDDVQNRSASDVPFAVVDGREYLVKHFEFAPGATLVLLTDGFYETSDSALELFGEQRVIDFVQQRSHQPLAELITELYEAVRVFGEGRPQADDLTAVLIRRDG